MSARSAMTVTSGTIISSAWGNLVRDHIMSRHTASDVTIEGQISAQTTSKNFETHPGAAVERIGGYGAWTAFTPVLSDAGGGGGAWSLGNGTLAGRYRYLSGRTVAVEIVLTLGTTSSGLGSGGAMLLSLPSGINMASGNTRLNARVFDASASTQFSAIAQYASNTQLSVVCIATGSTYAFESAVTGVAPITFAAGDTVSIVGVYEAAA